MSLQTSLFLAVAVLFAAWGFFKGAVSECFSILGLGLAFFLAPVLTRLAMQPARIEINQQGEAIAIAVLGSFFYVAAMRWGRIWHRQNVKGKWLRRGIDRLGGALLGALKGFAIALWLAFYLEGI